MKTQIEVIEDSKGFKLVEQPLIEVPKKTLKEQIKAKLNSLELEEARREVREAREIKKFKKLEKKRLKVVPREYEFDRVAGPSHRILYGKPILSAPIKKEPRIVRATTPQN